MRRHSQFQQSSSLAVGRLVTFCRFGHEVQHALAAMDAREEPGKTLAEAEVEQIRRVLAVTGGTGAARKFWGIERKTLYRKLGRINL